MRDIYIYSGIAQYLERSEGDVTGIPSGASLIVAEPEWEVMCKEAGGEAALLETLGAKWRGEPWSGLSSVLP